MIEGYLPPNSKVLVIEDLISTGKSSLAACDALIEAGAEIKGVLAIFTYGFQKAKDIFSERSIPMDTLSNYRNLLNEAQRINYITEEEKSILNTWSEDPESWAEQFNR